MNQRVAAVIVKDGKVLLMRRIKDGREYYVIVGGGVEEGESQNNALKREVKEEVSLDISNAEPLFSYAQKPEDFIVYTPNNRATDESFYYLVKNFSGDVRLGGPEKARMNEQNQYYPEWHPISDLERLENLYPPGIGGKIAAELKKRLQN